MASRRFLLLCVLCSLTSFHVAAATESRFNRTITALQTAPTDWRADFTRIALSTLATAHRTEAELARAEPTDDAARQRRWSLSVERYAHRLALLQGQIDTDTVITFTLSPFTDATVDVSGRHVILTHPRPLQQAAFEQKVLERFCRSHDCATLTRPQTALPTLPGAAPINPSWAFTADGPACSHAGLHLVFQPGDNPGSLRRFCTALFQEAARILQGMQEQQQHGVHINWQQLALTPQPGGRQHTLTLNAVGDTLSVDLPQIARTPELLPALQPWLAARLAGRNYSLSLQAAVYDWHAPPE